MHCKVVKYMFIKMDLFCRCQLYSTDPILSSTPVSFRPKTRRRASMQCGAHGHAPVDIHNHTPINSSIYSTSFPSQHTSQRHSDTLNTPVSGFQTPDKAAMTKIGKLESELLQLRQQLAAIALKQEQMSSNSVMGRLKLMLGYYYLWIGMNKCFVITCYG